MATLTDLVVELEIDADGLTAGARRAAKRVNRELDGINTTMQTVQTTTQRTTNEMDRNFVRVGARISRTMRRTGTRVFSSMAESLSRVGGHSWLIVGVIAAALATLPALAVLTAGAVVLALGGGLATVGLIAAAQSKKVRRSFSGLKDHVASELKQMAKPFEPTLLQISTTMRSVFDSLSPAIEKAFADMAPVLTKFVRQLGNAFEQLKPAIPILTKAFNDLLKALGPRLPEIFKAISDAIIELSRVISENPDLFAKFVVGLFKLLPVAARLIAGLVRLAEWVDKNLSRFRAFMSIMNPAIAIFELARATFRALGAALGWLGDRFNNLKNIVKNAWNALNRGTTIMVNKVKTAINQLRTIPGRVRAWFNRAKEGAVNRAQELVSWMRGLPKRILSALSRLGGMMFRAGSNIVQDMINGIKSMVGRLAGAAGSLASTVRNMMPFSPAKEGPFSGSGAPENSGAAIATQLGEGILGEMLRVDRAADQMMRRLDAGIASHVVGMADRLAIPTPGPPSPRMPRARRQRREPVRVEIDVTGGDADLKRMIRRMVRSDGGDVQVAFGNGGK